MRQTANSADVAPNPASPTTSPEKRSSRREFFAQLATGLAAFNLGQATLAEEKPESGASLPPGALLSKITSACAMADASLDWAKDPKACLNAIGTYVEVIKATENIPANRAAAEAQLDAVVSALYLPVKTELNRRFLTETAHAMETAEAAPDIPMNTLPNIVDSKLNTLLHLGSVLERLPEGNAADLLDPAYQECRREIFTLGMSANARIQKVLQAIGPEAINSIRSKAEAAYGPAASIGLTALQEAVKGGNTAVALRNEVSKQVAEKLLHDARISSDSVRRTLTGALDKYIGDSLNAARTAQNDLVWNKKLIAGSDKVPALDAAKQREFSQKLDTARQGVALLSGLLETTGHPNDAKNVATIGNAIITFASIAGPNPTPLGVCIGGFAVASQLFAAQQSGGADASMKALQQMQDFLTRFAEFAKQNFERITRLQQTCLVKLAELSESLAEMRRENRLNFARISEQVRTLHGYMIGQHKAETATEFEKALRSANEQALLLLQRSPHVDTKALRDAFNEFTTHAVDRSREPAFVGSPNSAKLHDEIGVRSSPLDLIAYLPQAVMELNGEVPASVSTTKPPPHPFVWSGGARAFMQLKIAGLGAPEAYPATISNWQAAIGTEGANLQNLIRKLTSPESLHKCVDAYRETARKLVQAISGVIISEERARFLFAHPDLPVRPWPAFTTGAYEQSNYEQLPKNYWNVPQERQVPLFAHPNLSHSQEVTTFEELRDKKYHFYYSAVTVPEVYLKGGTPPYRFNLIHPQTDPIDRLIALGAIKANRSQPATSLYSIGRRRVRQTETFELNPDRWFKPNNHTVMDWVNAFSGFCRYYDSYNYSESDPFRTMIRSMGIKDNPDNGLFLYNAFEVFHGVLDAYAHNQFMKAIEDLLEKFKSENANLVQDVEKQGEALRLLTSLALLRRDGDTFVAGHVLRNGSHSMLEPDDFLGRVTPIANGFTRDELSQMKPHLPEPAKKVMEAVIANLEACSPSNGQSTGSPITDAYFKGERVSWNFFPGVIPMALIIQAHLNAHLEESMSELRAISDTVPGERSLPILDRTLAEFVACDRIARR